MTGFLSKKINSIQTLGEKLTAHRQSMGLSQEKVARSMNINVRYIRLFERNNYKALPADVYALNILKHYAQTLKLNPYTVAEIFKKEKALYLKTQQSKNKMEQRRWQKVSNFILNPKFIKYGAIFLLILAMLYYLGWSVNKIISPPMLVIYTPEDNFVTTERQIIVSGQTEKEVTLKINNQPILLDQNGNFSVPLDLQKNLNLIKISAQKKNSKTQVLYRQVIVNDNEK